MTRIVAALFFGISWCAMAAAPDTARAVKVVDREVALELRSKGVTLNGRITCTGLVGRSRCLGELRAGFNAQLAKDRQSAVDQAIEAVNARPLLPASPAASE